MKKSKQALIHSVIALLLCVSMFVGTTFAWFTDEVTSMNNIIQSGTLDIDLEYMDAQGNWHSVNQNTNVFDEDALWEPGHTEVVYLRVINKGNLALKYQLGVNVASETPGTNVAGDQFKLSDYIKMGAVEGVSTAYTTREEARKAVTTSGTLASGYVTYGKMLANDPEQYIALVVYMPEEVDNVANYRGDAVPTIHLGINLLATQLTSENDSFGPNYDEGAKHPLGNINFTSTQSVADKVENGLLTEDVTIGDANGEIYAEVPDGVKLADGADSLELIVQAMQNSQADIQLEAGETANSLNVHMDGVAADNTVPMLITLKGVLKTGLNSTSVALYHVENGQTVPMTQVANPTNHNEFSYDPATGDVVMALKSFSEVDVVTDNLNRWEGTFDITWYNSSSTEFTLYTAEELAGLGVIVDGGYNVKNGENVQWTDCTYLDSFEDKTIKLGQDIYLGGTVSFNPIGCGYVNGTTNSEGVEGHAFMGTFDGQGNTIFGLYQNGWDIGLSYCNLGVGLFASIANGTVKDLTISGANIVAECVEMGVLVGLSQGTCTYENINIYNSKIANYQKATGGLIGEISAIDDTTNKTTITNVVIGPDVVVGTLWGDFDAPVGGVIGARWDDSNATTVDMTKVTVAARLDVYNDVTSAYQWYAYRRAGMLIGNTDTSATTDGRTVATADFLKCNNVKVCYGDWVNYHYCEFTNQDDAWQNGYPWVRVEAGENCSAYSNPRYGHPVVDGVAIENDNHTCTAEHKMLIAFNQLYGGGQGVYGQPEHENVEVINYRYTITYVNDYEVLTIKYVTETGAVKTENKAAQNLVEKWAKENITGTWEFGGWMNAGSTKLTEIVADNTKDIVLYPYFNNPYTARFVDQNGNVLAWCLFHNEDLTQLEETKKSAQSQLPDPGKDFELDYWEVHYNGSVTTYNQGNFAGYTTDVTVYPVYRYTGNLKLTPVDEDSDGTIDYYKVEAVEELNQTTTIPGYVNGVPVKVVTKLYKNDNNWDFGSNVQIIIIEEGVETLERNSLGYTENLTTVELPITIKNLGKNVFSRNTGNDEKKLTIKYNGTMEDWKKITKHEDWHNGLKTGTRVICSDGYYELKAEEYLWGAYETYEWTEYPNS